MGIRKLFQGRWVLALVLFLGTLFLVWWNPISLFQPVRGVLSFVTLPFSNALAWGAFEVAGVKNFFTSIGELKSRNGFLEKQNIELQGKIAHLAFLENENNDLRHLVGLAQNNGKKIIAAEVIGRDGSGLATALTINRGSLQGVKEGLAVITSENVLIGKVENVFPESAEIMLLPNPDSVVSATLVTNMSKGVVRGEHGLGMIFDLALQSDDLTPGASIVTSGLGDNFPPGLLIGKIQAVQPSPDRLFQQAILVSPVKFDVLRFVAVITL